MSARFSDTLRQKLDPVWEAQHQHPFVRGIGDGTLDAGRFEAWLRQDYLFLIEYARLFALAAARWADPETVKWMVGMAHGVLHQQMLLHEAYAVEFGLSQEELAEGAMLPTTRAYADHLLRTASLGTRLQLAAAMLPCLWGRAEIGQRLAERRPAAETRYARWVEMHSGPVVSGLARRGRELLDRRAAGLTPEGVEAAEEAFRLSSRYEWMFWQMCYEGESWPI